MQTSTLALGMGMLPTAKCFASFDGLIAGMKRDAKTASVKVHVLDERIAWIESVGGNVTVFQVNDGLLLVDAGIAEQGPQLQRALADVGSAPVREVINTHWHFDHTGGNPWLHLRGAKISAHPNTLKHLMVTTRVTPWSYTFQPIEREGRPTNLLHSAQQIHYGKDQILIVHTEHAHTDGDLMVRFEEQDVLSTGDVFWNGHYPFIDIESGGSIDGMIKGTLLALARSTPSTKIVPGHGPIASRKDLQRYCDMLEHVRAAVADAKRMGMKRSEAIAAKLTARFDKEWGTYAVAPSDFIALVYEGV